LNAGQFLTQVFTCTCEISYGRGNQTQKPNRDWKNQAHHFTSLCPPDSCVH